MIVFDYRPPSADLREYVRQLQIVGFQFGEGFTVPLKPYWPRPENCLCFYPRKMELIEYGDGRREERKNRASLMGQPLFMTKRQPKDGFFLFQVVFQPGVLFRLTGIPAEVFTNQFVDAEAVFSAEVRAVNERIGSTGNHLEMITIVENFLRYLVKKARYAVLPVDKAALFLHQNPRAVSLDWLAREACLSRKQFYRKFVERMGVSPKFYARIVQFDNAVKLKNACPGKDWLSIALELGYYDYQHLVRDCKELTGLTPAGFYLLDSHAPERTFGYKET
jgi:AraC-like DNA-binding protein